MPATSTDPRRAVARDGGHPEAPRRPRHRWRWRARWAVVPALVAAFALTVSGVAWAAWVSSGSGTTTAQAASAAVPTTTAVAGSAITSGLLYPSGTGTVMVTVNNPNPYAVKVTSITGNGSATAAGGTGTCTTTGVTFSTQTPGTAITANGSATITLANAAAMSTASQTGCQNATFTIPVTVTIESS